MSVTEPSVPSAGQKPKRSLAGLSLLVGIIAFFSLGAPPQQPSPWLVLTALLGVLGIVLAVVHLRRVRQNKSLGGRALAIGGLCLSALLAFCGIALYPVHLGVERVRCIPHVTSAEQVCKAIRSYCNANQSLFPRTRSWKDDLVEAKFVEDKSKLEFDTGRAAGTYMMNAVLDGAKIGDIKQPKETVLIFEVAIGGRPAGGLEDFPPEPHLRMGYVVGFVDGHAEVVPASKLKDLIWHPLGR